MRGEEIHIGPDRVAQLRAALRAVHAHVQELQPAHTPHRVRPE